MKTTEKNAVIAIGLVGALTAGLWWLLNVHWSFGAAWWWFALVFALAVGGTYAGLNEDRAAESAADADCGRGADRQEPTR